MSKYTDWGMIHGEGEIVCECDNCGNEERIVNLVQDEDFTAVFENTEKATLTVHKVDSVTKDPLKNAKFEVYKAVNGSLSGEVVKVGEYTSDSSGQFKVQHADTGWYRIVEKQAPAGYERKTESLEVFLKAGEDKEITFENSPQSAIIIRKAAVTNAAPLIHLFWLTKRFIFILLPIIFTADHGAEHVYG